MGIADAGGQGRKTPASKGIFCLEGEWDADLRRRMSVEPILQFLEGVDVARYIHRDVATREEFEYFIDKWSQPRYRNYRVLNLAMHGDAGSVYLGRDTLALDEVGEILGGRRLDAIVYFGSCLTMDGDAADLTRFVRRAGVRAVVGYSGVIDWLSSASFEVVLLQQLVTHLESTHRNDYLFRRITEEHGDYARNLGLTVATKSRVYRAE